jgi:hypothetical protein
MNANPARALLLLAICVAISACSDGGSDSQKSGALGTCGIRADVTGAVAIQFTGRDDAACATQHSTDTGLDAMFIGIDAKGTLEVTVDAVTEAETGSAFPTSIVVISPAKEHWQGSACVTSISEHRLLNSESSALGELRHYQVSAEGTCSEPLEASPPGAASVTLGPFSFRAEFTWRE